MLSVFRVSADIESFPYLITKDCQGFLARFPFDGMPLPGSSDQYFAPRDLKVPPFRWSREGDQLPDVACICGATHALAFNPSIRPKVQTFLDQAGQQFEIPLSDGTVMIGLNVTNACNVLNKADSSFGEDDSKSIEQYVFHARRLNYSLFKLPETRFSELLCVQGIRAACDEFRPTVSRKRISGLKFDLLWSERRQSR